MLLAGVVVLVAVSYAVTARGGDIGITTEVTAFLAFVQGALCGFDEIGIAGAITVGAVLLLALKDALHGLAARIEPADVRATLQFALITVIVLPLLPDRTYGPPPLDVLNPYRVWLMVVLISGLNFLGYVAVKALGPRQGLGVAGVLGGLVSSTALTLGFAQRSRATPAHGRALALGVLLAWAIMYARIVVEVAVVDPALARRIGLGMALLFGVGIAASLVLARGADRGERAEVPAANPFELLPALQFGFLFALVTVAAAGAEHWFGDLGLYAAGAVAGLTDVDAIALSMAQLSARDEASAGPAARTIVIAALANTLAKVALVVALGAPTMRRALAPATAALLVAGIAVVLWIG